MVDFQYSEEQFNKELEWCKARMIELMQKAIAEYWEEIDNQLCYGINPITGKANPKPTDDELPPIYKGLEL